MENALPKTRQHTFYRLKLTKKVQVTKNTFAVELEIPQELQDVFAFQAGQYVTLKFLWNDIEVEKDFSMTSAPYENKIALGIKTYQSSSPATVLIKNIEIGDFIEVSAPRGRFTIVQKPHEFRTIIAFAGGIGITPILSHVKDILHRESRTRFFLFYGSRNKDEIAFREELDDLQRQYGERLEVYYFLSQERAGNPLFEGRLDRHKVNLIINQILQLDDTDEESTIWDAVDEVLICGKGEMIRELANACYHHGIPKRNIHFELFEEFNEDIYPVEKEFPVIENIDVKFRLFNQDYETTLKDNKMRLLQQLLIQGYPVPYSCKSGICGSCICNLYEGEVEVLENEYLTEKEAADGKILACMSVMMSKDISVNFDLLPEL